MSICIFEDCKDIAKLKGMCRKHYNSEYFKQNKESILKSHRLYYNKNKEKMKKWRREYHRTNPEVSRRNKLVRKDRHNLKHKKYKDLEILELYGTNCHICLTPIDLNAPRRTGLPGWEQGLHIDHLMPISIGGKDSIENVRPAHGLCNLSKYNLVNAII
jgi:hypothetical protein